jgi:hypothetical protein
VVTALLAGCSDEGRAPEGRTVPDERDDSDMAMAAPGWDLSVPLYTMAQAERGEGIFLEVCSVCHLLDTFTSLDFRAGWSGNTVGELYQFLSRSMPHDTPGRLEPGQYADVLSFIFRVNNLPAGDEELGTEVQELHDHRLELPRR